jgi:hypothetical protein
MSGVFNPLTGRELSVIMAKHLERELQEHLDFSNAVTYINPEYRITVELEAFELEKPKTAQVTGTVPTGPVDPEAKRTKRGTRVTVGSGVISQPDRAREESNLVVPSQRQLKTGEVADFSPDQMPI